VQVSGLEWSHVSYSANDLITEGFAVDLPSSVKALTVVIGNVLLGCTSDAVMMLVNTNGVLHSNLALLYLHDLSLIVLSVILVQEGLSI